MLPNTAWEKDIRLGYKEGEYRAHVQRISINSLVDEAELVNRDDKDTYLYMVYLFDETDLRRYMEENRDQKPVVGLVYIDNYEETMDRADEVRQSLLNVLVDRKINKYFAEVKGLAKKMEKDKYLVILNQKSLDTLEEDRFPILEGVKTINIGSEQGMTISVGIGIGGGSYLENYEYARSAWRWPLAGAAIRL